MPDAVLESFAANPPASLVDVARLAAGDPALAISDWTVEHLSDQGIRNPDGLLLFKGGGGDGRDPRRWSVVLKIIANQDADELPQDHLWYWKREALAFESGLLDNLPDGVSAPRCYGVEAHGESVWIWMEHVVDVAPPSWTADEYVKAAHASGRFGGAYLSGRALPGHRWLARDHAREWTATGGASPDTAWSNSFVSRFFSEPLRERVMRLWDHRELVFDLMQRLPQTFAHGDYHRRNLIVDRRGSATEGIVAVDWAWCGTAPIGADLGMLLGMSAVLGDLDAARLPELERPVCDAYLAGLRDSGWIGDPALPRLGYAAWIAMYAGVTAPSLTAFWTSDERGRFGAPDRAARRWAAICEFALDRGDEARALAERLLP